MLIFIILIFVYFFLPTYSLLLTSHCLFINWLPSRIAVVPRFPAPESGCLFLYWRCSVKMPVGLEMNHL